MPASKRPSARIATTPHDVWLAAAEARAWQVAWPGVLRLSCDERRQAEKRLPPCRHAKDAPRQRRRGGGGGFQFGQDFTDFYFLAVAHEDAFDDRSFGGPKAR